MHLGFTHVRAVELRGPLFLRVDAYWARALLKPFRASSINTLLISERRGCSRGIEYVRSEGCRSGLQGPCLLSAPPKYLQKL
jgi:hypothetical protein